MRPFDPVENSSRSPRGSSPNTISDDDLQIVFTTPSGSTSRMALWVAESELARDDVDAAPDEGDGESPAVAVTSTACAAAALLLPPTDIVTVESRGAASGTRIGTEEGDNPGRELTTAA